MGYLDFYLKQKEFAKGKVKKIWITEEYPRDNQFWVLEMTKDLTIDPSWRWKKYYKNKNGKWTKRDVFGAKLLDKLIVSYMPLEEFLEKN